MSTNYGYPIRGTTLPMLAACVVVATKWQRQVLLLAHASRARAYQHPPERLMFISYECPNCGQMVSIFDPKCYHCHEKLNNKRRWITLIALAGGTALAARGIADMYNEQRLAIERETGNDIYSTAGSNSTTLYKARLGPCGHYAGVRGDPGVLTSKHAKCPNPECVGSPPRRIVRILAPIPGR